MLLVPFAVFVGVFVLAASAVGLAMLVLQRQQRDASTLEAGASVGDAPGIFKLDELSSISVWDNLLARFDFVEGMRARIVQSGLNWSVGRVTAMMLLIGSFAMVVLGNIAWLPGWVALGLGCAAALGPYFYVLRRRAKRFSQFEEQFPDALDFLARALRAGHPLGVTLEMLAQENSPPLSAEMRTVTEERKLGMQLDQALDNLVRRMPLLSVRIFVAAVQLHTRTGGRLGEAMGGLAETMRESQSLRGEVKALAANGKMTGTVLTILPLFIATMMVTVNPGYLDILFQTERGKNLIFICIACLVLAHFIIRKIVDIRP